MAKHDSDHLAPTEPQVDASPAGRQERMPEVVILLGIAGMMFAISGAAYKIVSLFAQRLHPANDFAGQLLWWLTVVGVGVSVGLFIHAGLLLLRYEWGRVGMLIYAVLAILLTIPAAWVRIARSDAWVADQVRQSDEVPNWAGDFGIVIHLLFAAVALIYPIALLVNLSRPRVRRAFRDAAAARRQ